MPSRGSRPKTPRTAVDPGYSYRVTSGMQGPGSDRTADEGRRSDGTESWSARNRRSDAPTPSRPLVRAPTPSALPIRPDWTVEENSAVDTAAAALHQIGERVRLEQRKLDRINTEFKRREKIFEAADVAAEERVREADERLRAAEEVMRSAQAQLDRGDEEHRRAAIRMDRRSTHLDEREREIERPLTEARRQLEEIAGRASTPFWVRAHLRTVLARLS